jgi:heme exporter protein CcmD
MLAIMEDAGFVIGSYVLTFGAIGGYAAYVLRRARRATKGLPEEAKPWT